MDFQQLIADFAKRHGIANLAAEKSARVGPLWWGRELWSKSAVLSCKSGQ